MRTILDRESDSRKLYEGGTAMTHAQYIECIEICNACAVVCDYCVSECLLEDDVGALARCIELDRVCADACRTASSVLAKGSEFSYKFCAVCADVCQVCADECARHVHMDHCRDCAAICRECAQVCREMAGAGV
jgi:hypothetical protein